MSKCLSAKYYQGNKEKLQMKTSERYQNLSQEEKEQKRQYDRELYKNLSENEKNKLVEYRKKYYKMRKDRFIIIIRKYFDLENFASL